MRTKHISATMLNTIFSNPKLTLNYMPIKLPTTKFILILFFLQFCILGYSQINYSEDFESETITWSQEVYSSSKSLPCNGSKSFAGETYSINSIAVPVTSTTKSLGPCNDQPVTFSFNYKLLDFFKVPVSGSIDWGRLTFEYANDINGEWTVIDNITTANHTESADCAYHVINFTPVPGANLYLRVTLEANIEIPDQDFYVYLDDIAVTQPVGLPCAGTPVATKAVTSANDLCNSQNAVVSLSPYYPSTGLSYQWQASLDGFTFTDISQNSTNATYTTAQAVTTWYRAKIKCNAGGDEIISDPVKVISSGYVCICDIIFRINVEPITLVSFAGINNVSSNIIDGSPSQEDFRGLKPGTVTKGESYTITLKGNTNNPGGKFKNYFTVLMDWNHNGSFDDAGEKYEIGYIVNSDGEDDVELTGQIAVPKDALTGNATMRIIKNYARFTKFTCGPGYEFGYGQAEDYLVTVNDACTIPEIEGETSQIITQSQAGTATLADVIITTAQGATVSWYTNEADANTGSNVLNATTILENGKTYYVVQQLNGCRSNVFAVIINLVLGVNDFNASNFKYYPNPVIGNLTITATTTITLVEVYNMLGQHVLVQHTNDKNISVDLKQLTNGAYFVKVKNQNTSTVVKIIKR